jgi:protein-disulfide isomerase
VRSVFSDEKKLSIAAVVPDVAGSAHAADDVAVGHQPRAFFTPPTRRPPGNPKGDGTIVAFLDYNCPFCEKSEPDLERIVKEDGRVRLVYKDWPALTEASIYGAQLALAAKYQGEYDLAHHLGLFVSNGDLTGASVADDPDGLIADLDQGRGRHCYRRVMTAGSASSGSVASRS